MPIRLDLRPLTPVISGVLFFGGRRPRSVFGLDDRGFPSTPASSGGPKGPDVRPLPPVVVASFCARPPLSSATVADLPVGRTTSRYGSEQCCLVHSVMGFAACCAGRCRVAKPLDRLRLDTELRPEGPRRSLLESPPRLLLAAPVTKSLSPPPARSSPWTISSLAMSATHRLRSVVPNLPTVLELPEGAGPCPPP